MPQNYFGGTGEEEGSLARKDVSGFALTLKTGRRIPFTQEFGMEGKLGNQAQPGVS